ncbi:MULTISPECIES: phage tail protein [Streptomyces]|uniref:Phage tail protein n=1 Tax=Streptomyces luteosporeus TaxID=173856 RepID=A0ABP6G252_9ACTN
MSVPAFRYRVSIDGQHHLFCSVSGLEISYGTVEIEEGSGDRFVVPGRRKFPEVSLRHGSADGYQALYDWISSISGSSVEKKDVTVALLDETLSPAVTWTVIGAIPVTLTSLVHAEGSGRPVIGEFVLCGLGVTAEFTS